jgi:hypothetical protein
MVPKALARIRAHPVVATAVVLATIVGGVANAGVALEKMSGAWKKWTQSAPALETTWQGVWAMNDGHVFDFVMRLEISSSDSAEGEIRWHLRDTPPKSPIRNRINARAIEYVSGSYDRDARVVQVKGTKVSDPTLLALDDYKFQIRSDNVSFAAVTRAHGDSWDGAAEGRVIIAPRKN